MSRGGIHLVGCGGHGRVVLDALLARGIAPAGILDGALPAGSEVFGVPVLGGRAPARRDEFDACAAGMVEEVAPRAAALRAWASAHRAALADP
ncbi:MAG: hypothetical protein ACO37C_12885 [Gemmobacter sp.]